MDPQWIIAGAAAVTLLITWTSTVVGAALWVVGIGGRMAFSLFMQHGGASTVVRFSQAHRLTGAGWVTAIVLMAFVEVVSRTLILWVRSRSVTVRRTVFAIG